MRAQLLDLRDRLLKRNDGPSTAIVNTLLDTHQNLAEDFKALAGLLGPDPSSPHLTEPSPQNIEKVRGIIAHWRIQF